jgi:hypothetical protein
LSGISISLSNLKIINEKTVLFKTWSFVVRLFYLGGGPGGTVILGGDVGTTPVGVKPLLTVVPLVDGWFFMYQVDNPAINKTANTTRMTINFFFIGFLWD